MRKNLPVTGREYAVPDLTLMSATDTASRITYANPAFTSVSGFDRDELLGQPHNVVRHPDMPGQAYADMWATLKAGKSWTALVKNRRKNGDHYWVRANAAPIVRDGTTTGYLSVRTKPTREEVAQAEQLYKDLREGRHRHRGFHQGIIVRTGPWKWASLLKTMPVRWRIRSALAALLLAGWAFALAGTNGMGAAGLAGHVVAPGVLVLMCCAWLEAQIARPLELVERQALRVAAGQAPLDMRLDRTDEIGMIMRAVNQSGWNLHSLLDDVGEQVSGLMTASSEIAQGNDDLSVRTEQAASSLQETATSMEQMTSTVKSSADTAREAADLASSASAAAARGGVVVSEVVGTMNDITASSRRIGDIIGVIDGISFQTNILALNAAVEAARAGEQGRGFAVVASEVRSLASRSAEAAREIKQLIGSSVEKVEAGAVLVQGAGSVMDEIVAHVRRVTELMSEISVSASEQSTGIGHVNIAVAQLEQMTQQNAALVEQAAAASQSMKSQTGRLADAVGVFKKAG